VSRPGRTGWTTASDDWIAEGSALANLIAASPELKALGVARFPERILPRPNRAFPDDTVASRKELRFKIFGDQLDRRPPPGG